MTNAAILFMGISVTSVVSLLSWCYFKVLTAPDQND